MKLLQQEKTKEKQTNKKKNKNKQGKKVRETLGFKPCPPRPTLQLVLL